MYYRSLHSKKYSGPVLCVRLYLGIVTVSCRLLQRMKIWASAMPAKMTQKNDYGLSSLVKFVSYLLHHSTGALIIFMYYYLRH